jgi:hypothetical protein
MPTQTETTDVLIIGGGTGGVAAALGAARAGARVMLIEQEPYVGGTITGSYVSMPCGEPRNGIYGMMLDRLAERYALSARPVLKPFKTNVLNWYLPSSWLVVMNEMLTEAGVRVIQGLAATEPIMADIGGVPRVTGAICPLHGGAEMRLDATVTIDATGSGAFAEAAGCEMRYGTDAKADFGEPHAPEVGSDFVQHCTLMYISQKRGDRPAFDMTRLSCPGVLEGTIGYFHRDREESLRRDAGLYLHWGSAAACRDTRDPLALAEAQAVAQRAIQPDIELLHANGFMVSIAPRIGVREVRRTIGEHVITENDLRSGNLPEDTVALGDYYLDIWGSAAIGADSDAERKLPLFGIPYRALVPKGVDGLLLAGKSISGTHIAMSAYRVQPILATYSQAAGVAAAWCADKQVGPRDMDIAALRAGLTRPEQGVLLDIERC